MKKLLLLTSALMVISTPSFADEGGKKPWLEQQLSKQRYKCPVGKSPVRGPADAQVTIVEFIDYDCSYCADEEATLKKVLADYPTQVRLAIKNLPLEKIHPKAKQKALVAECMASQDKFWQAHDHFLAGKPGREGGDQKTLNACVEQGGDGQVDRDLALAKNLGLATTPSFVVDGIRIGGTIGPKQFKALIDAEIARKEKLKDKAQDKAQEKDSEATQ